MTDEATSTPEGTEDDGDLLVADGFADAFIGVAYRMGRQIAVYDRARCIEVLIADGMAPDEAEDYFSFNTEGAWVGEGTPIYVERCSLDEIRAES